MELVGYEDDEARSFITFQYMKYSAKFEELLKDRIVKPSELRLVEYCWYDCSEAPDYFTCHDDFYDEV